jgi:hypothetical protein
MTSTEKESVKRIEVEWGDRFARLASHVSPVMIETLVRHVVHGTPTGSFLQSVLENNLVESFGRADEQNLAAMRYWAITIGLDMPAGSWGSRENVAQWCESGGLLGMGRRSEESKV